jgi:hypothetical protein
MSRKIDQRNDVLSAAYVILLRDGPMPVKELAWRIGSVYKYPPTSMELAKRMHMDNRFERMFKVDGSYFWGVAK